MEKIKELWARTSYSQTSKRPLICWVPQPVFSPSSLCAKLSYQAAGQTPDFYILRLVIIISADSVEEENRLSSKVFLQPRDIFVGSVLFGAKYSHHLIFLKNKKHVKGEKERLVIRPWLQPVLV